jgi:hypothetical protein
MPLPMTLDHINFYLVDSGSGWYIIDTGLKGPAILRHWEALFERGLDGRPVLGAALRVQVIDAWRSAGVLSSQFSPVGLRRLRPRPLFADVTPTRYLLFGANTR